MYKIMTINKKDYKLEYTIEASLYRDCTEKIATLMLGASQMNNVETMVKSLSDIPQTTLSVFYAGLIEHHSVDSGDGTVARISDAKKLIKEYMQEHKEDGTGNFYELLQICIQQMGEDNFFDQVGLMITSKENTQKAPQDHKKKSVRSVK